MVSDHLELHEIGEHPSHRKVHIQGNQVPLHGARPGVVKNIVDPEGEAC